MIRTIEAVIDQAGNIRLLEPNQLPGTRRAFVMTLDDSPSIEPHDTAILRESALGEDCYRPEEGAAWSHLQQPR